MYIYIYTYIYIYVNIIYLPPPSLAGPLYHKALSVPALLQSASTEGERKRERMSVCVRERARSPQSMTPFPPVLCRPALPQSSIGARSSPARQHRGAARAQGAGQRGGQAAAQGRALQAGGRGGGGEPPVASYDLQPTGARLLTHRVATAYTCRQVCDIYIDIVDIDIDISAGAAASLLSPATIYSLRARGFFSRTASRLLTLAARYVLCI